MADATHSYILLADRIARLPITVQERAILWRLARWGNWEDGSNSYPSQATLAAETGLSERQVRFWLADLSCDPREAALGLCRNGPKCHHRGLIVFTGPSHRYGSSTYTLMLEEVAIQPFQPHLPEVGLNREPAAGRKPDQQLAVIG